MAESKEKAAAEPAGKPADPVAEVQARVDKETEQGFRGIEADPTPNENYTVAGVTDGKPTPETDEAAADEARAEAKRIERGDAGVI